MFSPDPDQMTLLYLHGPIGIYKVTPKVYNVFGSTYFYWKAQDSVEWHGPFVTPTETVLDYEKTLQPSPKPENVVEIDFVLRRRI